MAVSPESKGLGGKGCGCHILNMGRRLPAKGSNLSSVIFTFWKPRHAFFTPKRGKCRHLAAFACPVAPEKGKLPAEHP
jgi:hypothetical protein